MRCRNRLAASAQLVTRLPSKAERTSSETTAGETPNLPAAVARSFRRIRAGPLVALAVTIHVSIKACWSGDKPGHREGQAAAKGFTRW